MRILIIRPNSGDFGKVGSYNVQEVGLANALARNGHKVDVIYTHKNVEIVETDQKYNFVHYVPHKSFGLHGLFNVNLISNFDPEFVIIFSDNQILSKNIIKWCNKRRIKVVNYFGGVLSDNPRWINQFYTKLILFRNRKSYQLSFNVAKTKKVCSEMERYNIKCDKIVNVGLDLDILADKRSVDINLKKELGFKVDDIVILFVGRLVDYKNPLFACQLLKNLLLRNNKYKLVLIGKGPLENEVKKFISDNNLYDEIRYINRVPYDSIYKYMVSSSCLINLSPKEIFGMTILEAMYYGVPVVAHHAPGPDDIIDDGKTGFLINSFDVNEWSDCVEMAINNLSIIDCARKTVIENFTWDGLCDDFLF